MDVELSPGGATADVFTTIDGKRAKLTTVHLRIKKTLNPFKPSVDADVSGISVDNGAQVRETVRG
jgi:hypothetical protein